MGSDSVAGRGGAYRRIARKLARRGTVIGLLVLLAGIAASIAIEYGRGMRRMHEVLREIERQDVERISDSVWVLNDRMLSTELRALVKSPYIAYADVREPGRMLASEGRVPGRYWTRREYPLVYRYDDTPREIGTLTVFVDRGVMVARALRGGMIGALYPALTIAVVAFFFYISFHRLVVRRVLAITEYLREFNPVREERALRLGSAGNSGDELDEVSRAINELRLSLNARRDELEQAYALVSREVDAKTRELELTNQTLEQQIEELEATRRELTRADEAKTLFLANVSHELRTPLTGIIGLSGLLGRSSLEPEQQRYLTAVEESARSLLAIVDDLLDFSRLESDREEIHPAPFDPREALHAVVDLLEPVAQRQDCSIALALEPEVPNRLLGDSLRLQQILRNLINNAIKFAPGSRISLSCQVESPGTLLFSVADTGPGVPESALPHLFDSFYQAPGETVSTPPEHRGIGLGLAISRRLATLMGGSVDVESRQGEGTRFDLRLPMESAAEGLPEEAQPEAAPPASPTESEGPAAGAQGLSGLRILVAEDNAINRLYLEHSLSRQGHQVTVVADGKAALGALEHADYDIILMDIQMPVLDGVETTRVVRGFSSVPIIALTAYAREEDLRAFRGVGMDEVVTKPISEPELQEKMRELVEGR